METNIERRDKILKLRSEGMSYGEITKKLNCNKSTVAFYCSGRYLLRKVDEEKERAKKECEEIAKQILSGSDKDITKGSTYFSNKDSIPKAFKGMVPTYTAGTYVFWKIQYP